MIDRYFFVIVSIFVSGTTHANEVSYNDTSIINNALSLLQNISTQNTYAEINTLNGINELAGNLDQTALSGILSSLSEGVDTSDITVETLGNNMMVTIIDPDTGKANVITVPVTQ